MKTLLDIMRTLRAPDGCPWDQKQTHASLRPYLLEEAAEAVDAITSNDPDAMADELGDVLLQVAFHAVIGEEEGRFSYRDIETAIVDKLVRRHPHVFGETEVADADEVVANWQAIKAAERSSQGSSQQDVSPAERVSRSLPALLRAYELSEKLGWTSSASALSAKTLEVDVADTGGDARKRIGEMLLAVVDEARRLGVNPEIALREAADVRVGLSAVGADERG
ncbi:MAG: MazG family protein [Trueperaceae bacterium]|nr:MazG family protein [Trueperaceae bacterium]